MPIRWPTAPRKAAAKLSFSLTAAMLFGSFRRWPSSSGRRAVPLRMYLERPCSHTTTHIGAYNG